MDINYWGVLGTTHVIRIPSRLLFIRRKGSQQAGSGPSMVDGGGDVGCIGSETKLYLTPLTRLENSGSGSVHVNVSQISAIV